MNARLQLHYMLRMLWILPCLGLLAACEKQDDGPTSADVARCAHIDREADLGEALYDICLNNPWPTELPPATQEGLSTFGGIINDTLVLGALLVQYDQFAPTALAINLISIDTVAGKVYDVAGRTSSPYMLDTAALMSVLTQKPAGQNINCDSACGRLTVPRLTS